MNALANAGVDKFLEENFVSSFQKVATFRIVGKQKQGGNVATYFCAPDGRVLHCIAGPVDAQTFLREARWVVAAAEKAVVDCKGDGGKFKAIMRAAHAQKLRTDYGLVVQPVTYDAPKQDADSPLTYRDPTGQPLAPILPPPPIDGPDVKFRAQQEIASGAAGAMPVRDRLGRRWSLPSQGRVHMLLAAHSMNKIETIYASIFQGILGEQVSTRPIEIVNPFPWHHGPGGQIKGAQVRSSKG